MSYILCLGFHVKVYKKFPKIRIFLNDIFIDEFLVSGVENNTDVDYKTILSDEFKKYKNEMRFSQNPCEIDNGISQPLSNKVFLKFFELDESYINSAEEHKLRIQVFNNDNNYTNGFLTQSTCIMLRIASIIPKKILTDYLNFILNHELVLKEVRSKQKNIKEILNYYTHLNNQRFFNPVSHLMSIVNFNTENCERHHLWYNEKGRIFKYPFLAWVGISGYTELYFDKTVLTYNKLNAEKIMLDATVLYLLGNKYVQYENQRNIN
jgi:hypothetical protein